MRIALLHDFGADGDDCESRWQILARKGVWWLHHSAVAPNLIDGPHLKAAINAHSGSRQLGTTTRLPC